MNNCGTATIHRFIVFLLYRFSSSPDHDFEPAVCHLLHVERHVRWVAGVLQTRIAHHLLVNAVAVGLVLVRDEREHHRLALLRVREFGEGHAPLHLHVLSGALGVRERTVIHPHLAADLRHLLVRGELLGGNNNNESINVSGFGF